MRAYTVHAPPREPAEPERFVFVKDGFCWPALFLSILWILWHRMWLTLMGYVIYILVLAWIERLTGETNATIIGLLGALLFALEANNIRRLSLANRGWRDLGGSYGRDLQEAEIRFFTKWNRPPPGRESGERREAVARAAFMPVRRSDADDPILGLFPEPER
jgi:uncharacterized protein DUF2628